MHEERLVGVVEIPLAPHRCLYSNARCHWAQKSQRAAELRLAAKLATLDAMQRNVLSANFPEVGQIGLRWVVILQGRERQRDIDNQIGALKAAQDGIFDAIDANDARVSQVGVTWIKSDEKTMTRLKCAIVVLGQDGEPPPTT